MRYLIHTYPSRLWYVEQHLIPSMLAQAIASENISVFNDTERLGNLFAFIESLKGLQNEPGGTWHIQDDVIICRDFKKLTEKYDKGVVCGYCCRDFQKTGDAGIVPIAEQWYSFPCIRIPNDMIPGFLLWFANNHNRVKYSSFTREKKFDDYFWKEYCRLECNGTALNLKPNLVDHVDYLIGGTLVNKDRLLRITRATYFQDGDLVDDLAQKLNR